MPHIVLLLYWPLMFKKNGVKLETCPKMSHYSTETVINFSTQKNYRKFWARGLIIFLNRPAPKKLWVERKNFGSKIILD